MIYEQARKPSRVHAERHDWIVGRLAQSVRIWLRASGAACAVPRSGAAPHRERTAADHLRSIRPLHRSGRCDRHQPRLAAHARGLGEGARRCRGNRRPRGAAGRQRQCQRRKADAALPETAAGAAREGRPVRHATRIRPPRHHHAGNGIRRHPREPAAVHETAKPSARAFPISSPPNSSAAKSPAAAPSSRPTSITPNSSRWSSAATSW